ncbi:hypothetical protein HU749_010180 [Pseudomonas ogarae]|uniref:hypothetical protein n=1 Tax=Pseudomonas ogarae (strain DSM 112162 / CECT 30235 / F113) TaxID=1114970 RepID=UPI0016456604|nr:hypothetical protein [Pseudomonas zarinae]QXH96733.1 hypothetical protein HU749_010180 [Pseudomonas zarinae]
MFVSRSGASLNAIYGMDPQGKPEIFAKSSPQGVALSDAQKQAISNSKFFEAGASMSLLDQPGKMGDVFDEHAKELATLLKHGLNEQSEAGETLVYFQGQEQHLRDLLQASIAPLSAQSDQIGRQMTVDQAFHPWLLDILSTPLQGRLDGSGKQSHIEFLTKVRALSAFGTTIWQLMNPVENHKQPELYAQHKEANTAACVALLREVGFDAQADDFAERFKEFSNKTRTPAFDNPLSRSRSERMPMVEIGGELRRVNGIYEDAAKFGLGFGQVIQNTADPDSAEQFALRAALGDRNQNINGIAREGAPIADLTRPFTMSEIDMENVPDAYTQLGIAEMLDQYAMLHGTGINRWQLFGTFAMETNLKGLPSAGAHSGGTCDILLALSTLNPERIYGNAELVLPAGLGIAAFMNFGGYHTFSETFPIAEAAAANRPYFPTNLAVINRPDLYQRMGDVAERFCPQGSEQLARFHQSHGQVLQSLQQQHPDLESFVPDVEFHASEQQIMDWRAKVLEMPRKLSRSINARA